MKRMRQLAIFTAVGIALMPAMAMAAIVDVTVMIENLSPTNSISFAPTRVGFHNGTFDAFNNGQTAGAAIVSIAEGGSGSDWFPAFAAADPTAVLGTVVNAGPAIPGGNAGVGNTFSSTASATFRVDTSVNRFFTFANMVVPSNDLFLGNDNAIELFDTNGNLLTTSINQTVGDIWDANSEVADPANAAFVVGGVNGNRIAENGTVAFDASELAVFNGLTTGAGYIFTNAGLTGGTDIFRLSFSSTAVAVPEPCSVAFVGLGLVGFGLRQRRKKLPAFDNDGASA